MGIPHLITFLRPFAPREPLANQHVVIDGPGFAHHIYYICLSSSAEAKNAFEAAPSYSGLVAAAVSWLEALRESGVKIDKIYFDGFLPPSKMDTRLSRLAKYTTHLSQFHTKYPVPCRAGFSPTVGGTSVLFGNTAVRSCLGTLPPLPFLVPAILEALVESGYQGIVEVVPGEADSYCAKYVHDHGGIILTGDSDLLVHALGEKGAVTFLKDILVDESTGLSSLIYRPATIADRIALPGPNGLHYLAFEMFMDAHGTFPKLMAKAKLRTSFHAFPKLFADFIQEYSLLPEKPEASDDGEVHKVLLVLRKMDPRISEYALQFNFLARIAGQVPAGQASGIVHVFLPFILDCPVRTNAWEISTGIRQLGYGLINLLAPTAEKSLGIFEHRRQQNKSKGLELQLPNPQDIAAACASLSNVLLQINQRLPNLSSADYWLAVAVYQEVEWAFLYAKPSLSESVVRRSTVTMKEVEGNLDWDHVHMLGQIQGCLYSFRLLKQLSSLVVAHYGTAVLQEVASLHQQLLSLPELNELPGYADVVSLIEKVHMLGMISCFNELLGHSDQGPAEAPTAAKTAGKKRKRKRDKSSLIEKKDHKRSSNPFDLLDVE